MPPEVEDQIEDTVEEVEEPIVEEVETEEESEEEPVHVNSQAQGLFDLLNNPATAKSTLRMIASNLGMTLAETKSEEGQEAIADVIKKALGPEMEFLADKLGPLGDAIEKLINARISKVESTMNERNKEREAQQFQVQSEVAMTKLGRETKGEFDNLLPKINKLMLEIPIGKSVSPEAYLRRLYTIAKSESSLNEQSPNVKTEKARREAKNNAPLNTANTNRTKNGSSSMPTIREAVQAAMRGEKI